MKKLIGSITVVITIILCFASCGSYSSPAKILKKTSSVLEIDITDGEIIENIETHGGLLGDGLTYVKIKISDKNTIENISNNWKTLPLSENLASFAYGTDTRAQFTYDGVILFDDIETGYYYFCDNHSEATDKYNDAELLNRYSINMVFAIFDTDNSILYYCKYDT